MHVCICIYVYVCICIHMYLIYKGEPGPHKLLLPWGVRTLMKPCLPRGPALWPTKKGSVLVAYTIKQSR